MRDLTYPVRYLDAYGHQIADINISVPVADNAQLQIAVADAGNKAFGDTWATAHIRGLNLTVENSKAKAALEEMRQRSQVVQALSKIAAPQEEVK